MPAICSPLTSWRQTPAAGRGCCVNLRATLQNSVPGWSRSPRWQTRFILPSLTSSEGKAVGSLALMRIDIAHGVVEVGHVHFSPLLSRTAMATEAHWLLMQYVFDTLGYRRYEWKCNSLNIPSARAARRLGFQYEGRFRQALVSKGHNRDTDWFSVIDGEWPELDNAMRQWLAADNFTADGNSAARWRVSVNGVFCAPAPL